MELLQGLCFPSTVQKRVILNWLDSQIDTPQDAMFMNDSKETQMISTDTYSKKTTTAVKQKNVVIQQVFSERANGKHRWLK